MIIEFKKGEDRDNCDKFWFVVVSNESKKTYEISLTFDEYKNIISKNCTCRFGTIQASLPHADMKHACKHVNECISLLFTKEINYLPNELLKKTI
jgi:hypothetical protein